MPELRLEIEDGVGLGTMDNPPVNAARRMPIGIRLAKENLNMIEEMDVRNAYRWEQTRTRILQETEDGLEAKKAFAEKRQPVFHGR